MFFFVFFFPRILYHSLSFGFPVCYFVIILVVSAIPIWEAMLPKAQNQKTKYWAGYLNALLSVYVDYITKPVNGFWNFIYRNMLVILYCFKLVYECQSSIYIQ